MEKVKLVIDNAIDKIIKDTAKKENILRIKKRHDKKVHFIPIRYRVFNGLLQSMNIKFGDFIEQLFQEIVKNSPDYKLEELSGIKRTAFNISAKNDNLIDAYITNRQGEYNTSDKELKEYFNILSEGIQNNCLELSDSNYTLRHDIDLFFKENDHNNYYYAEIKYNDDHDSGKYVDINRKFIKTYAYLHEHLLEKYDRDHTKFTLKPLMFFFTNKKMTGNIYIPEDINIYRGEEIFDEFFNYIEYASIDQYLKSISENESTVKKFDDLYKKVMEIS